MFGEQFDDGFAHAFACHFNEAKCRHGKYLRRCAIKNNTFGKDRENLGNVFWFAEVNEIDDDQPADAAQAQLTANFGGSFEIGSERCFFQTGRFSVASGIDVN